ncbi:pyruvate dehydrogenase complex dihydrolipoamide acetyltransferase [Okibacterium endophyticum]
MLAGSEEAAIANWLVEKGQTISVGDPLAEIETEKAVVEYNSEDAGVVGRVLLAAGEACEIGAPIAVLIADGETDADIDAVLGETTGSGAQMAPAASGPRSAADATERDPDSGAPVLEAASLEAAAQVEPVAGLGEAPEPAGSAPRAHDDSRLFVSPIARKLAKERGIDLRTITGSGPEGRIVRRDVEEAPTAVAPGTGTSSMAGRGVADEPTTAPSAAAPAPASGAAGSDTELVPHTPMRKAIARRLTESKSTVPHFYLTTECRVDELLALRARVNERSAVRVSLNDFVVKAVAAAFQAVPEANVTWSDRGMRTHRSVDVAVAVATDGGLVTPVVRRVDGKSVTAVSASIADLAARAKAKKLRQDELEGGSFSVSNLGMYGTLEFAAILNPPHSGILAVGAAKPQPVVVDGELRAATVMRCTLSVDHRAVDGALAARWLAAFTECIENPLSILV